MIGLRCLTVLKAKVFYHFECLGTVGEWRDYLTFDQSKLIDEKVQKILGDTNLKFVYDLDNTRCNL